MRRLGLLLICLLLTAPAIALGADLRLAWNNCDGAGGTHSITFDCSTNSAAEAHTLVASFTAPAGITAYVSNQATILIQLDGASFPDWWAIKGTGQCRSGAAIGDANFTAGPFGCTDLWGGLATGSLVSFNVGFRSPTVGRMNLVFSVPSSSAQPLVAGQEYYAFKVTILNTKTVGAGSCTGCGVPAALFLSDLDVLQPANTPGGNVELGQHNGEITSRSVAGWQCPAQISGGCPPGQVCDWVYGPNCATPARSSTWGMIKAIYH